MKYIKPLLHTSNCRNNLTGLPAPRLWLSILAGILLVLVDASVVRSQFLSRLSNPAIPVQIEHPPGLALKADKIVFGPAAGECSDEIIEALKSDFVENGIEVINRQDLDLILSEHDFSFSGYVDQASAARMGQILGPSALLSIRVTRCATDQQRLRSSRKRYDSKTKSNYKVTVYHARTRVFLRLSVQTTDLTTGRIFAAKSLDHSPSRENLSEEGYPEYPQEFDVRDIALGRAIRDIHRMFLPWVETKELIFFNSKPCNLKAAHQALKMGDSDRAFDLSLENIETCRNNAGPKKMKPKKQRKFLANAYYNAGMMHRIRGDLDAALEHLRKAAELRPADIMAEAIADCREAIEARNAMQRVEEHVSLKLEEREATKEQARQAREKNTLSNDGVIALVKTGLPEAIILKKIETSKCKFDLSAGSLVALTEAGVGQNVIVAMMEKQQ